jgi:hypothetical protein
MALEGTHIRFALDLKDKYGVTDLCKYIVGTVYPDSRYVTNIAREATHPEDFPKWDIESANDFKKGWAVHLLADEVQYHIIQEFLPETFRGERGQGSETWIKQSAVKTLQDMEDMKGFDIKPHLPCLRQAETPNGESVEAMERYYGIFLEMYADPQRLGITSGYEMWRRLGVSDDLCEQIELKVESYASDPQTMAAIKGIYPEMLRRAGQ